VTDQSAPESDSPFDCLPQLSDDAVAAISDLLVCLHLHFDARYFDQLRRHYQTLRPDPPDPRQPWLTGLPPPDPF
jgi:hypothetical protein